MGGRIEGHRPGAALRGQDLDDREFFRRVLVGDRYVPLAGGGKRQLRPGIKRRGVDALTGFQACDHPAIPAVHHQHLPVAAAEEKPVMFQVDCQARGLLARGDGPVLHDCVRFGIDHQELILVFQIQIDLSRARVGLRVLRFATHGDRRDDLARLRRKYRDRLAAPVEGVDLAPTRLVENGVRVLAGGHLGDGLQCLQVDDTRLVLAAIARKTPPQLRREGNAMHPGRVRDLADDLVAAGVDHDHLRGVSHI